MEEEEGKHRDTEDTERRAPGQTIREMREIHYRNSRDLCGRSTTETARISTGDPLPKQPGSSFAPLRLCTFAFISALRFELASNLEEGIEDRFADVVEFRLKMIDEFMQPVIHDLFDV